MGIVTAFLGGPTAETAICALIGGPVTAVAIYLLAFTGGAPGFRLIGTLSHHNWDRVRALAFACAVLPTALVPDLVHRAGRTDAGPAPRPARRPTPRT